MKRVKNVEEYFIQQDKFKKPLAKLRLLLLETELEERLKWSAPIYCLNNKNVVGLMAFKNHFGLWFFNGLFLKDKYKLLQNAQDGKTQAMRHLKYTSLEEIDFTIVKEYILEAIENQKQGKEHKPQKKVLQPNVLMQEYFSNNQELTQQFNQLSQSCKNEYIEYISEAKKEETQHRRMQKIIPMIMQNVGLNDKYRNC